MPDVVELYGEDGWYEEKGATVRQVQANHYEVTLVEIPIWIRINALDGAPMRINGQIAMQVWGSRVAHSGLRGGTMTLQVLMPLR